MKNETQARNIIIAISVLVAGLVTVLAILPKQNIDLGFDLHVFPLFHAILNGATTVLLLVGLFFIKQKNIALHKASMLGAFVLSTIFLLSYVFYHYISEPTKFGGEGVMKGIYYFILLTHILLAAVILPFILFTFYRALAGDFEKHKKIARYTLPIWLYVTITGVLVYLMISPYYQT